MHMITYPKIEGVTIEVSLYKRKEGSYNVSIGNLEVKKFSLGVLNHGTKENMLSYFSQEMVVHSQKDAKEKI